MALAFGVATAGAGACFQSVEYGCDEDAQCRVGTAEGVCAAAGFCAYEDESCFSGQRFGPYAGGLAYSSVEGAGTTGRSTTGVVGSESSTVTPANLIGVQTSSFGDPDICTGAVSLRM